MASGSAMRVLDFDFYIHERAQGFSGRNWVFERIDEWLAHNGGSRFLLFTGEPGSGKTAIAARLAQFSAGSTSPPPNCPKLAAGCLNALHFCVARAGNWVDPISFARSISLQLAQSNPLFALALKNAGDRSVNIQVTQRVESGGNVRGVVIENLVLTGFERAIGLQCRRSCTVGRNLSAGFRPAPYHSGRRTG
jgi:hypothetical protein